MCGPVFWGETNVISHVTSRGKNEGVEVADERNLTEPILISSGSGRIL